jgi:hypothetical protein
VAGNFFFFIQNFNTYVKLFFELFLLVSPTKFHEGNDEKKKNSKRIFYTVKTAVKRSLVIHYEKVIHTAPTVLMNTPSCTD